MLQTPRLRLRWLQIDDAAFMLRLFNDAAFLRYIGDRGIRSVEDAARHIEQGPQRSYREHGFGMYLVEPGSGGEPLGICGLIRRDTLPQPDLGFAFAPEYRGMGYAVEAGREVLREARDVHALREVLAITTPDNDGSIAVLRKLGFAYRDTRRLSAASPELKCFELQLQAPGVQPDTTHPPD